MKKVLLLSAVVCAALAANAQALHTLTPKVSWMQNPVHVASPMKAPAAKADLKDDQFIVGLYTSDAYDQYGLGLGSVMTLEVGSVIPSSYFAGVKGLKVDGIRFAVAQNAQINNVKLYGLEGDNVYEVAKKAVNKTCSTGWTYVEFDEPVAISSSIDELLPVYEITTTASGYQIAVHKGNDYDFASFYGYGDLGQGQGWYDFGEEYGTIAIQLVCSAEPLSGFDVRPSRFESSTVAMGQTFKPTFTLTSTSESAVTSVDYTVTFGGKDVSGTYTFKTPIEAGYGKKGNVEVELTAPQKAGSLPIIFSVDAINGKELETPIVATYMQDVVTRLANRTVVLEEYTGTGCPWCTRGWVGMEKVKKERADKAVVIAIHQFNNTDPMYGAYYHTPSYQGAPGVVLDRKSESEPYYGDNDKGIIPTVDKFAEAIPEVAIEVEASYSDADLTKIDASAVTEFLTDLEGSELVFVLTADGLTGTSNAWKQSNAYANYTASQMYLTKTNDPELYEFCKGNSMGQSSVSLVFNDVMIGSSWPSATQPNKVPAFTTTAAGEKASSAYTLTLPTKTTLKNALLKDQIYVTAFVLKADGTIANGARCKVNYPTGLDTVLAPSAEEATYDLSGRVAIPNAQGIVVKNGKKVIR